MGRIGLEREGETEDSVLARFKGREDQVRYDDDEEADVQNMIRDLKDDDGAGSDGDEQEEEVEQKLTPKQRREAEKQAKRELVAAQNAAGQAKAAAKVAATAAAAAAAPAKGKTAAAATPASSTVVSLSRAKPVKEEPAPRGKQVKQEEDADMEDAEPQPRPVQPKDAFPLNNVTAVPAAAPPRTVNTGAGSNLKWWQQAAKDLPLSFPPAAKSAQSSGKKVSLSNDGAASSGVVSLPDTVEECVKLAQEKLAAVVSHFEALNGSRSSDARWLSTVMSSGTLSDKVAGMTLMVQEAPLYRLAVIDALLAMAHKQGRRENSMASDALKDLFLNDLLPPRKLVALANQPYFKQRAAALASGGVRAAAALPKPSESALAYMAWEDALKTRYLDFLSVLEAGTHDEMTYIKKARVQQVYDLLLGAPERERVLLSLLVNKLGDGDKKIGARVVYLLGELIKKHPAFKLALISELEQLLYRSNISKRAQYFAIIFLNQVVFTAGGSDEPLANKLISVYFLLFKQFIAANKQEREQLEAVEAKRAAKRKARAMAQAEGGHRPFKASKFKEAPKQYGGSNSVSAKVAAAIARKKGHTSLEASDALRSKLLGGLLTGINRALPYATQLAVEGGEDLSVPTDGAHATGVQAVLQQMDMLFNLVHTTAFPTSVQALMLLYQVLSRSIVAGGGANTDRFYRALYDKVLAPELLTSTGKHGLFLNLLYKSLKNDPNAERVAAFAKRLLQVAAQHQPPFICGVLFMLSEVLKTQRGLAMLLTQPAARLKVVDKATAGDVKPRVDELSDDEEEHFRDVTEEEEADKQKQKQDKAKADAQKAQEVEEEQEKAAASSEAPAAAEARLISELSSQPIVRGAYDPMKREPQYAQARSSCLWELLLFARHFHPSVSRFANTILSGESITYPGDPLKDFTAMNFLDRFCFKNPKQQRKDQAAKKPAAPSAFTRPDSSLAYTPVNTPAFLARAMAASSGSGAAVADDQQFLARYFTQKSRLDSKSGKGASQRERELEVDATEEEEEAFAEEIIEREMRKVEGGLLDEEEDDLGAYSSGEEELDFEGDDAPMSDDDVDEEAAAEAEALAEMEAGGDDSEEGMSGDDDDEDEFPALDSDEEDEDEDDLGGGKRDRNASVFASAEEFADLLNSANDTGVSAKQSAWEKQRSEPEERGSRRGGRGASGYKAAPKPGGSKKKGGGAPGGVVPEKPSFKRKLAEARASSGKKGKGGGGGKGKGGRPAKKQRK